jgi:hypothetical protein
MSLQKTPPSLPPEKLLEQSTSAMDSLSTLEQSYPRRLWEYAWQQTREHQTVELIASAIGTTITAFITGSIWGGIAAGVVAALLTPLIALIVILIIHLLRAPAKLDKAKQREIDRLNTKIGALNTDHKSEIEKLKAEHRRQLSENNAHYETQLSSRLETIMSLEDQLEEERVKVARLESIPKLEILFDNALPFVEHMPRGSVNDFASTIRIGVRHNGNRTVHHVQARVEKIDIKDESSLYELPLRLMHDRYPYQHDFSVDAGETQYVDVASMGYVIGDIIAICHVIADEKTSFIAQGTHDLRIKVTGQDALPCTINLRVFITSDGLLAANVITG